jgi:hypothetical protein
VISIHFNPDISKKSLILDEKIVTHWVHSIARAGFSEFKTQHNKRGLGRNGHSRAGDYLSKKSGALMTGTRIIATTMNARLGTSSRNAQWWVNRKDGQNRKSFYDALLTGVDVAGTQKLQNAIYFR